MVIGNKFIFYHVPKTGGVWVRENLEKMCKVEVKQSPNKSFWGGHHEPPTSKEKKFTFCFFRNPFEWYRSLWKYKNTGTSWVGRREKGEYLYDLGVACDTFNGFIKKLFDKYPEGFCTTTFRKYETVDFIGSCENLISDFETAMMLSGETVDWTKLNKKKMNNSEDSLRANYTPKSEKLVWEADQYIFQNFYPRVRGWSK